MGDDVRDSKKKKCESCRRGITVYFGTRPVRTTPHRRPLELLYVTCEPRRVGARRVAGRTTARCTMRTRRRRIAPGLEENETHNRPPSPPTIRLPGRRRTSCRRPCVDIIWYLYERKYLPTAKQTRIPTLENRDDNKRSDRGTSPRRGPKTSEAVRPSVGRRARSAAVCVRAIRCRAVCVRAFVRARTGERAAAAAAAGSFQRRQTQSTSR